MLQGVKSIGRNKYLITHHQYSPSVVFKQHMAELSNFYFHYQKGCEFPSGSDRSRSASLLPTVIYMRNEYLFRRLKTY